MRRSHWLEAVSFATGFASLLLQIVWQRIISLHGGVDLVSSTTVVAAFMAGLGLGNLLGGVVADRVQPRSVLRWYAASAAGVGCYGLLSPVLLYDGFGLVAGSLNGVFSGFLFNLLVLAVPTTLMGVSLPLLARAVVSVSDEAAPRVGRLYAVNTLGAACGAASSCWFLLGTIGFVASVRVACGLYLLAAVVAVWLSRTGSVDVEASPRETATPTGKDPAVRWYLAYALTGATALGLEVVCLRLVDALMRSNAYTFGHVLTLYLLCFAFGAAAGARLVKRAATPGRTFLLLQLPIAATSLLGLLLLVHMPVPQVREMFESYFASDGYLTTGPTRPETARAFAKLLFVYLLGPLTVMGAPVFLMGAAFPFVQAEVSKELSRLGRGTGRLLFSNIVGNVTGTLLVSFVALDALGTAGTIRLLAASCVALGVIGLVSLRGEVVRLVRWSAIALVAIAAIGVFPSNERLWGFFHAASAQEFEVIEERACVNAWVTRTGEHVLFLNATSQNGWPYDDFHVVIGMVPSLLHPSPKRALAVGLGAGSTAWSLLQDDRLSQVQCVEICGGEIELIRRLAAKGSAESRQLFDDPRSELLVGDGRKHLLVSPRQWDVITVDAMRPNGASAGNVYSREFYSLVASRLVPQGLFAQWIPTERVLTTVAHVFPYVMTMEVPGGRGRFLVASNEPITFDRDALVQRVEQRTSAFTPAQREAVLTFARTLAPLQYRTGQPAAAVEARELNTDLFPRDEYFLNSN